MPPARHAIVYETILVKDFMGTPAVCIRVATIQNIIVEMPSQLCGHKKRRAHVLQPDACGGRYLGGGGRVLGRLRVARGWNGWVVTDAVYGSGCETTTGIAMIDALRFAAGNAPPRHQSPETPLKEPNADPGVISSEVDDVRVISSAAGSDHTHGDGFMLSVGARLE